MVGRLWCCCNLCEVIGMVDLIPQVCFVILFQSVSCLVVKQFESKNRLVDGFIIGTLFMITVGVGIPRGYIVHLAIAFDLFELYSEIRVSVGSNCNQRDVLVIIASAFSLFLF